MFRLFGMLLFNNMEEEIAVRRREIRVIRIQRQRLRDKHNPFLLDDEYFRTLYR